MFSTLSDLALDSHIESKLIPQLFRITQPARKGLGPFQWTPAERTYINVPLALFVGHGFLRDAARNPSMLRGVGATARASWQNCFKLLL